MAGKSKASDLDFRNYDSVRGTTVGGLQTITGIQDTWESVKLRLILSSNHQPPHIVTCAGERICLS